MPTLSPAPWGFTGEWHDAGGLVYLRARWYNPAWGRFTQVDPWPGTLASPATRHAYAYGVNNPLRYYDPTDLNGGSFKEEWDEFWLGFARQWLYNNAWFNPYYQRRFAPTTDESSAVRLGRGVANLVSVGQALWEISVGAAAVDFGAGATGLVAALATGGGSLVGSAAEAVTVVGGALVLVHGVGVGVTAVQSARRMLMASGRPDS